MKKLLLLSILLVGCYPTTEEQLSAMKSPVVLIGKNCMTMSNIHGFEYQSCTVALMDSTGSVLVLAGSTYLGMALSSRNVGDTIK